MNEVSRQLQRSTESSCERGGVVCAAPKARPANPMSLAGGEAVCGLGAILKTEGS